MIDCFEAARCNQLTVVHSQNSLEVLRRANGTGTPIRGTASLPSSIRTTTTSTTTHRVLCACACARAVIMSLLCTTVWTCLVCFALAARLWLQTQIPQLNSIPCLRLHNIHGGEGAYLPRTRQAHSLDDEEGSTRERRSAGGKRVVVVER